MLCDVILVCSQQGGAGTVRENPEGEHVGRWLRDSGRLGLYPGSHTRSTSVGESVHLVGFSCYICKKKLIIVFLLQGCLGLEVLICEKHLELGLAQVNTRVLMLLKNTVTGVRGLG